jgi:hypothetical protein
MGPRCSSAETQVYHRSYIIAASAIFLLHADVNIHASNRQIWYRHPNSEAGNDEIQKVNEIFEA